MFEHLEIVIKKFEDLSMQLSDPKIIAKPQEFSKLSKEYSDMKVLVQAYQDYKKINQDIIDNEELMNSKDQDIVQMAQTDNEDLLPKRTNLEEKIKVLLLPKDPNDEKNVVLEIRAGTGGDEAALFAADLFRMYMRYCEKSKWKLEVLSKNETGLGGLKEIIVSVEGYGAYSQLKYESGVHRVQRVPDTEQSGRIHTSAVTVAVMPEADEVDVVIQDKDLQIDVMRSGGPGGQSVNTTDSAVRITHKPTGMMVVCQDEKSQHKNKAKALKVLRARLLEIEQEKQRQEISQTRKSMVGSGDRSERIRTYNFPQNRLTDHRIGLTLHKLDLIMEGDLIETISSLQSHYQTERLKESGYV